MFEVAITNKKLSFHLRVEISNSEKKTNDAAITPKLKLNRI